MNGIWKNIPLGTLLFTNSFNSAKSVLRFDGSLFQNISEMDEKYSFSFAAISSDFVYLISSMITSSGKLLFELLSLLFIFRKCCHIALVSFESVTESEKCLRLAIFINCFVLFRYVLKSIFRYLVMYTYKTRQNIFIVPSNPEISMFRYILGNVCMLLHIYLSIVILRK